MPKISIVTPVHNEEMYFERCVSSVLKQKFTDWELILVDDGSTDKSGEMCDRYAATDSRIKVLHQSQKGYSGARNAGLDLVTSDYVTLVDADDFIEENALEIAYRNMTENDVDLVIGGHKIIMYQDESRTDIHAEMLGVPEADYFFETKDYAEAGEYIVNLCGTLFYCVWGKLYRMDIIRDHGLRFDTNILVQEDVNFTFCYLYHTRRCVLTKELFYNYGREFYKDDVGEREFIDQHLCNEPSLQSFLRMAFKFKFSTEYCTKVYDRLSEKYLQLASKILQSGTGLSEDEQRRHVYPMADNFAFRFYCEKLSDIDPFWADMYRYLQVGELEKIYQRFVKKVKDDNLPRTGASNIL